MSVTIESVLAKSAAECVRECASWIVHKNIHLRITGMRASKLGDYRPHPTGNGHQITVNHDLNPFAFLITFTHEVAHLVCYERYGHRHEPHGREWKRHFRELLLHFLIEAFSLPSSRSSFMPISAIPARPVAAIPD